MSDENEIGSWGKFTAGVILISLTAAAIILVISYWPNKMPPIKDGDDGAWYTDKCFNITLIESDSIVINKNGKDIKSDSTSYESAERLITSLKATIRIKDSIYKIKDSSNAKDPVKIKKDSIELVKLKDSLKLLQSSKTEDSKKSAKNTPVLQTVKKIHLNTILLILVALMGFLGNMIHIATSFTTFVGEGTFKRSWLLWYFVKPFTAAALAIIVYFIIMAGFLSYGTAASGISLYGVLSLSALAGLFTDSATLKLKEVFEVIFKPKDERSGKLEGDEFSVLSASPDTILPTGISTLVISGKNLNKPEIKITIDKDPVVPSLKAADKLEIKYTPTAAAIAAKKAVLFMTTEKAHYSKDIIINS